MKKKLTTVLCAILTVILSVFAFAACGDTTPATQPGDDPGPVVEKPVYKLAIAEKNIDISMSKSAEHTAQISASVTKDGKAFSGANIAYTSTKPEVATVSATGLVTAVAVGDTKINVRATIEGLENPLVDQVSVSVLPPVTSRELAQGTAPALGSPVAFEAAAVTGEEGDIYSVMDGVVSFTAEQLADFDAKYAAKYTYLTFELKFPTEVSKEITANLGGTELAFRNESVPFGGYYYPEEECTFGGNGLSLANLPKNFVDKSKTTQPAFLIYDANGDAVVNKGCNKDRVDKSYKPIGGLADGKMAADNWYSVVISLENRAKAFATAGLSLGGLAGAYIKNIQVQSGNPYEKTVDGIAGDLYEAKRVNTDMNDTSGASTYVIERVFYYGTSPWGATSSTYYVLPAGEALTPTDTTGDIASYTFNGASSFKESVNTGDTFTAPEGQDRTHFLLLDYMQSKPDTNVVRFDIVFNQFQTIATGGHSPTDFNFFAYVNSLYQYVTFNAEGVSKLENAAGIAIYNENGRRVLDGWTDKSATGSVIETGKKYTFEFDLSIGGTYKGSVMFAGCDYATVSNITWASNRLSYKSEGALYEVAHSTDANAVAERLIASDNGYTATTTAIDKGDSDSYNIPELITAGEIEQAVNSASSGAANEHFFTIGSTHEKMDCGASVLRFDIVFASKTEHTKSCVDNTTTISGADAYNFAIYVNGVWQYLIFYAKTPKKMRIFCGAGLAVYNESGASILSNSWNSLTNAATSKANAYSTGSAEIELNKKYTFEFNLTLGTVEDLLMFYGADGATISNIVWSSNRLSEEPVAVAINSEPVSNLIISPAIERATVGTPISLGMAYSEGFGTVALPVTLGDTVPESFNMKVYGKDLTLNVATDLGKIDSDMFVLNENWEAVTTLAANTKYLFVISLDELLKDEEQDKIDFEKNGIICFGVGFDGTTLDTPIAVNKEHEGYEKLAAWIEENTPEPEPEPAPKPAIKGTPVMQDTFTESDYGTEIFDKTPKEGTAGTDYVYEKGDGDGEALGEGNAAICMKSGYIQYTFTLSEAGEYVFMFSYNTTSSPRGLGFVIDFGTANAITKTQILDVSGGSSDYKFLIVTVSNLSAGEHTLRITAPENFDPKGETGPKSCNVNRIGLYQAKAE